MGPQPKFWAQQPPTKPYTVALVVGTQLQTTSPGTRTSILLCIALNKSSASAAKSDIWQRDSCSNLRDTWQYMAVESVIYNFCATADWTPETAVPLTARDTQIYCGCLLDIFYVRRLQKPPFMWIKIPIMQESHAQGKILHNREV